MFSSVVSFAREIKKCSNLRILAAESHWQTHIWRRCVGQWHPVLQVYIPAWQNTLFSWGLSVLLKDSQKELEIKPPSLSWVVNPLYLLSQSFSPFPVRLSIFLSIYLLKSSHLSISPHLYIAPCPQLSLCLCQLDTYLEGSCRLWQGASRSVGYSLGSGQRWRCRSGTQQTPLLRCSRAELHDLEENRKNNLKKKTQANKEKHLTWN